MSSELQPLGRMLLLLGIVLIALGSVIQWGPKLPWLGRLPGDIAIRRDGFSFYVPVTSSLIVSGVVSLMLWLIGRFRQ